MSKEKQIEEMASIIYRSGLSFKHQAERLYDAGYRKQSEGEWKPIMAVCNRGVCSKCNKIGAVRWKYCPECGAEMKGGAE
jgi:hypothetical protein